MIRSSEIVDTLDHMKTDLLGPEPAAIRGEAMRRKRLKRRRRAAFVGCAGLLAAAGFTWLAWQRPTTVEIATAEIPAEGEAAAETSATASTSEDGVAAEKSPNTEVNPVPQDNNLLESFDVTTEVPELLGRALFVVNETNNELGIKLLAWRQTDGSIGYQAVLGALVGSGSNVGFNCSDWGLVSIHGSEYQFQEGVSPVVDGHEFLDGGGICEVSGDLAAVIGTSFTVSVDSTGLSLTKPSGEVVVLTFHSQNGFTQTEPTATTIAQG